MNNAPIGVFDSGVGGLSVARAIKKLLPNESICYLADGANTPYGNRHIKNIKSLVMNSMGLMESYGVKMIVLACNTASCATADSYNYKNIPVMGTIKASVQAALNATQNGRIAVLATSATILSETFQKEFAKYPHINASFLTCPKFVDFVESGIFDGPDVESCIAASLSDLDRSIDTILLGCTHYAFLKEAMQRVLGDGVRIVSCDYILAENLAKTLADLDLLCDPNNVPQYKCVTTAEKVKDSFLELTKSILG